MSVAKFAIGYKIYDCSNGGLHNNSCAYTPGCVFYTKKYLDIYSPILPISSVKFIDLNCLIYR